MKSKLRLFCISRVANEGELILKKYFEGSILIIQSFPLMHFSKSYFPLLFSLTDFFLLLQPFYNILYSTVYQSITLFSLVLR